MDNSVFRLEEMSIEKLFIDNNDNNDGKTITYEIPIYQRNYAWQEHEIDTLIQDITDASKKDSNRVYYIGTLVTYNKGDGVFEIIDGQQRLTTIRLILAVLNEKIHNRLAYRARKKSDDTLKVIDILGDTWNAKNNASNIKLKEDEVDKGLKDGYEYVQKAYKKHVLDVSDIKNDEFIRYFKKNVHIIRYQVPKDVDLNHYFEVMNSRGEQLEKHEIVKARLMEKISNTKNKEESDITQTIFGILWECCSDMDVYVQHNMDSEIAKVVFGEKLDDFKPNNFDELKNIIKGKLVDNNLAQRFVSTISIEEIINSNYVQYGNKNKSSKGQTEKEKKFQEIIDFPNFLLIVLKITIMQYNGVISNETNMSKEIEQFVLDDKELLYQFDKYIMNTEQNTEHICRFVCQFAYNLLKAKFYLDNYIVHHLLEEDSDNRNPWKLQTWTIENKKAYPKDLANNDLQEKLVHLLSMFEVSFTPRPRKNYLFYILLYLLNKSNNTDSKVDLAEYAEFIEKLADRYFYSVYLNGTNLYEKSNIPKPGSFDSAILTNYKFNEKDISPKDVSNDDLYRVFGNCENQTQSIGNSIPLFVFNYLDYKIWKFYSENAKGEGLKNESKKREDFFNKIGCESFDLNVFKQFYFSRTRRSLEHFYPQKNANGENGRLNSAQINCLGNYAMIGREMNSSGSNLWPKEKLNRYKPEGKAIPFSVASLKFIIMMKICERHDWNIKEIKEHQEKMLEMLGFKSKLQVSMLLPKPLHESENLPDTV